MKEMGWKNKRSMLTISLWLIFKSHCILGTVHFLSGGGMVVLRAFIDHFVLNPQQMQENFQWPPFYSKFSSHDPPPLHAWPPKGFCYFCNVLGWQLINTIMPTIILATILVIVGIFVITLGRYDTEVINSAPIFFPFCVEPRE